MSISFISSKIAGLQKQKFDLLNKKADCEKKRADFEIEIHRINASISRSTSLSTRQSKQRDIERKSKAMAELSKKIADIEKKRAEVEKKIHQEESVLHKLEAKERNQRIENNKKQYDKITDLISKHGEFSAKTESQTEKSVRRFITVLFSDIVGSSKIPDEPKRAISIRQLHWEKENLQNAEVIKFKNTGDGNMVVVWHPFSAVKIGLAIREFFQSIDWNELGLDQALQVRIGIHCGFADVIFGEEANIEDVSGNVVNIAARIEPKALPNQIVCSEEVISALRWDTLVPGMGIESLGIVELPKGSGEKKLFSLKLDHVDI